MTQIESISATPRMRTEPLSVILTSDIVAKARGRAVPSSEFGDYLEKGCGWVPANMAVDVFGHIATDNPFGAVGDIRLMPDPSSKSTFPSHTRGAVSELVFSDIVTQDGDPWPNCPRTMLKDAIAELKEVAGLAVLSSFEHEFMVLVEDDDATLPAKPFSLEQFLRHEDFGGAVIAALQDGGLEPEMWLPEYGPNQWEVTLKPAAALTAADRALYLREFTSAVAAEYGLSTTFSPIIEKDGGGNGVHVHLSLQTPEGEPVTYDPERSGGLSEVAGSFASGLLEHARVIQVLAASSPISYERLAPMRWSSGGVFLGKNNREALLRICPLFNTPSSNPQRAFNLEYRAADATSNPYLLLAALIRAGTDGIKRGLAAPQVVEGQVDISDAAVRAKYGIEAIPGSLSEALELFEQSDAVSRWFSEDFISMVGTVKRSEIAGIGELDEGERYRFYADLY